MERVRRKIPGLGRNQGSEGVCRKIIVFQDHPDPDESYLQSMGGRLIKELPLLNAAVVEVPAEGDAGIMAEIPGVARIDDDLQIHAYGALGCCLWHCLRDKQSPQTVPWGLQAVEAERAWEYTRGEGISIAVIDTGIDHTHPDLKDNLGEGYNVLKPGSAPDDDNGHGTHVAGTIAAIDNSFGVVGVAPRARVHAVKSLDRFGNGFLSDLIEALDWCVSNGIRVVNMSLGSPEGNESFHEAIKRAYNAGVVLVAAAGNEGGVGDTVGYPARYPETIAVSAIDVESKMPGFASRGPDVDVLAPGVKILSTWPGNQYRELNGTSMATPHVAGIAAMVLATHKGFTPDQAKRHLRAAARRVVGLGYPVVDAYKSITT